MPITEVVRDLLVRDGTFRGHPVRVALSYDVDGRFGPDEAAIGHPQFWLRVWGDGLDERRGPFEHEDDALAAASEFGAG